MKQNSMVIDSERTESGDRMPSLLMERRKSNSTEKRTRLSTNWVNFNISLKFSRHRNRQKRTAVINPCVMPRPVSKSSRKQPRSSSLKTRLYRETTPQLLSSLSKARFRRDTWSHQTSSWLMNWGRPSWILIQWAETSRSLWSKSTTLKLRSRR